MSATDTYVLLRAFCYELVWRLWQGLGAGRCPVAVRPGRLALVTGVVWIGTLGGASAATAQQPPAYAQVPGSPFPTGIRTRPFSVAFSPGGRLLATANSDGDSMSVFSVGAGGALTPVRGSPFRDGTEPLSVAFSPSGGLLATANSGDNTVGALSVGAGGTLTQVAGSPVAAGRTPWSVAFGRYGGLLAVANSGGNDVSVFSVRASGALVRVRGSPFRDGSGPDSVAFSPDGRLLAIASYADSTVSVFSVGADGNLSKVARSSTGRTPRSVAFSPGGRLLAVANSDGNDVSVFAVRAGGALKPVRGSPFQDGSGPLSVAFSSDGGLLATANSSDSNVAVFSVGVDGRLTTVPGSPFPTGGAPTSVAFSPDGKLLATANLFGTSVSVFAATGKFEVGVTADRGGVAAGGVLSYTITVYNPSRVELRGAVSDDLTAVLDKAIYENDARASTGSVTVDTAGRRLTWEGALAAGVTATIRYSVRFKGSARGFATGRVSGPPGSICGPPRPESPELPCVTETPVVPSPARGADLELTETASTPAVHPGGQVIYTLVVRNRGPAEATGVTVSDPVPAGMFLQSVEPSQGSCAIPAVGLTCRLGALRRGGEALVLVAATVAADPRRTVVDAATAYAQQHDPRPGNNTAHSTVAVSLVRPPLARDARPEPISELVAMVGHAGRATVSRGARLRYTITVTNRGPDAAAGIKLTDASRLPFRVLSVRATQGLCDLGPPITCALGTLRAGARTTITITGLATVSGDQAIVAAATTSGWDPNPARSLATAKTRTVAGASRRAASPQRTLTETSAP